jgi:16S rRNA (cytosine1402-N4)-methyltransferase
MHLSVLQKELLDYLEPKRNENFVDATVNGGGDTLAILKTTKPEGKVLAIDWTPEVIRRLELKISGKEWEERIILVNDNFAHLKKIIEANHFPKISGIVFDLGLSSWHLENLSRGFSFQREGDLDMRYNPGEELTAKEIINYWPQEKIDNLLKDYGEEKFHSQLAEEIIKARKIRKMEKVSDLVALIERVVPRKGRIHPATKTFQALRIAVNKELENLEKALPQAMEVLEPEGRLVVITFQGLENKVVKKFFQEAKRSHQGKILTKQVVTPSIGEKNKNPRSRSAQLRAIQKN